MLVLHKSQNLTDCCTSTNTHRGFLLDDLQDPLGGKQEVNEAAEAVSSVLPFHYTEELPEDGASSGTEGSVQG